MTNKNNILKFIEHIDSLDKDAIKCEICNTFDLCSPNESKEKFSILFKNVNDKCYCLNCYNQYLALTKSNNFEIKDENNKRPNKSQYYLNIAKIVASRSTCLRRKYGAIIVKDDSIISTGYNGSPRGTKNCIDLNECRREKLNIPRGQCYEMCRSIHAEQNCIINAKRSDMIGSTLYLYGMNANDDSLIENLDSCQLCKKMIINAGIEKVVLPDSKNKYKVIDVKSWVDNDETLTNKFGY